MSTLNPHRENPDSTLGPLRFSLRGMFLAVTLLSVMFAAMAALGSIWSLTILLFAGLVLAHVLGNSLGTRLRDRASAQARLERNDRPVTRAAAVMPLPQPSRLTENARLHRVTFAAAVAGGLLGGMLGATGSAFIYPEAGAAAVVLGLVSLAVLGALGGFGVASFVCVARGALREALGETAPKRFSSRHHP